MLRAGLSVKLKREAHEYMIHVGSDVLSESGEFAAACLGQSAMKVALVSNPTVFALYGAKVSKSLRKVGYKVETLLIGDGERHKSLATAEKALDFLSGRGIGRSDGIVALGGGVVGDLAGFVASVHLRGIKYLQIPTTLLSMIDSSVGGKTAVNTPRGKNLVGSFHQPSGVLVDVRTLGTLGRRELVAGFCEAVKHSVLAGGKLFSDTRRFLERADVSDIASVLDDVGRSDRLADLVARQIDFKRRIVQGDEAEEPERTDSRSRKILNLGHTFGHALEMSTGYRRFRHGEAVGHGLVFSGHLSKELDLLSEDALTSLTNIVQRVGGLPSLKKIDKSKVKAALAMDKKNIAGSLQWVLLQGIGSPVIKPSSEIPRSAFDKAFNLMFR